MNAPTLNYTFQRTGPGGGGSTFEPTISYHDPKAFLLRCDMTGTYMTKDGGITYRQFNFPGGGSSFAWDSQDSSRVWAGSMFLQRSDDGGQHWKAVFPHDVMGSFHFGDHAEPLSIIKGNGKNDTIGAKINALTLDPSHHDQLYFGYGSNFYHINDTGGLIHSVPIEDRVLYIHAGVSEVALYASGSAWTYEKDAGKIVKMDLPQGMFPLSKVSMGYASNGKRARWYALGGKENRLWISDDGRIWSKLSDRIFAEKVGINASINFNSVSCSATDADKAYLLVDRYTEGNGATLSAWSGVMNTTDGGLHWTWCLRQGGGKNEYAVSDGQPPSNLKDAWAGEAFGKEYVDFLDVGVDPRDGRHAVVTDWYRVLKTDDGGITWSSAYSLLKHDGTCVSGGLDVTTCYRVHFDPQDSDHIAVSYTDIGYWHSQDRGGSWQRSCVGVPRAWNNTCYDVLFDPKVKGRMWSAWSSMHDIPRGKMTRDPLWKKKVQGGVCLSEDGGKSWSPSLTGMGEDNAVTSLLLDPNSSPGRRRIYAAVYNKGVFRSDDDGITWKFISTGIGKNSCAFALAIDLKGRVFVTVCPNPDHRSDGTTKGYLTGSVLRSDDQGRHWTALSIRQGPIFPVGISSDPVDADRLYLSCWGEMTPDDLLGRAKAKAQGLTGPIGFKGGVWLSTDAGAHWNLTSDSNWYAYNVTPDPGHPSRLFVNTFNSGAWYSNDRGAHWGKIGGYDFAWGHRVFPDQNDTASIFMTTYGSGVWKGSR